MKKVIVAIMLFMGLVSFVQAEAYKEGEEYILVSQPTQTGDKIEVLEFFWYGCPHCFSLEPHLQKWLETKPDNVEFIRIPAVFRPGWKMHARTYYALKIMGIVEEIHPKIFNRIHEKKKKLDNLKQMSAFLAKQKVDKEKFLETYNSFSVEGMVRKALKKLKDYDVRGVPAVAVNGSYYITGKSAGSYENLIRILNHLIKKETASKAK